MTNLILAQQDAPPPPPQGEAIEGQEGAPANGVTGEEQAPPAGGGGEWGFLLMIVLMFVLLWLLIIMPQRKEKKRKEQMISTMKKGDRVQTIGGILGTIAEIRDNEVVVKVDESNNTRLHFAKAAVQAVLDKDAEKNQ